MFYKFPGTSLYRESTVSHYINHCLTLTSHHSWYYKTRHVNENTLHLVYAAIQTYITVIRGNMTTTRIEALVFCLLFSTPTRADVKSSYYKGERDFDNKTFQNRFLTENPAESLIACSVMCSESRKICGCFGYNSKKEKCRLHETCNTEQSAVYEEGWRNYCPDGMYIYENESANVLFCIVS